MIHQLRALSATLASLQPLFPRSAPFCFGSVPCRSQLYHTPPPSLPLIPPPPTHLARSAETLRSKPRVPSLFMELALGRGPGVAFTTAMSEIKKAKQREKERKFCGRSSTRNAETHLIHAYPVQLHPLSLPPSHPFLFLLSMGTCIITVQANVTGAVLYSRISQLLPVSILLSYLETSRVTEIEPSRGRCHLITWGIIAIEPIE